MAPSRELDGRWRSTEPRAGATSHLLNAEESASARARPAASACCPADTPRARIAELIPLTQWRSSVGVRKPLVLEDVSEVSVAFRADDLYAHPVGVGHLADRSGNTIIKSRPAAPAVKFGAGKVQRLAATAHSHTPTSGVFRTVVALQIVLELALGPFGNRAAPSPSGAGQRTGWDSTPSSSRRRP